jgi:DNA primase
VVVEGYTDVMACHLAGITTAVATCGTAFGTEHIKIARRLLSDDGTGGEVIFTFDGDAAGQKAALRAFEEDQRFTAQTYVAVEPTGADPCDLRQSRGDEAVHALVQSRRPLFEFAIRTTLKQFNLDTVEGRVQGLKASVPVVAAIRDASTRTGYCQALTGWLGMPDPNEVLRLVTTEVKNAGKRGDQGGAPAAAPRTSAPAAPPGGPGVAAGPPSGAVPSYHRPDPRDPVASMERQALEVALQEPSLLVGGVWERFSAARFATPAFQAVHDAMRATDPALTADPVRWVEHVMHEVPEPLRPLVSELAVVPLPASTEEAVQKYCRDILSRLFELQITRVKADKMGQLQRLDPAADPETYQRLNRELMMLEMERRALRSDA